MSGGLTIFIDEGGDAGVRDGLRFHHSRHEWFSLGAYVVRSDSVDLTVSVRDEIMREAKVNQSPTLHYYKLKPDRRQQVCSILGRKSARAFCLLSHKTNMRNHYSPALGKFDAIRFYNWCSRLLLERIMEFAANDAEKRGVCVEPAHFIFSENKGHDYEGMKAYYRTLDYQAENKTFHLQPKRWLPGFITDDRISVQPHDALAGLQLADVIASAFLQGANSNAANHDLGPALGLKNIMAKDRKGTIANSGVTLWPLASQGPIPESAQPLFEEYGYKF
ncbi:DUF3800 domain-containing protein [Sphingopyxis fribergensis]